MRKCLNNFNYQRNSSGNLFFNSRPWFSDGNSESYKLNKLRISEFSIMTNEELLYEKKVHFRPFKV